MDQKSKSVTSLDLSKFVREVSKTNSGMFKTIHAKQDGIHFRKKSAEKLGEITKMYSAENLDKVSNKYIESIEDAIKYSLKELFGYTGDVKVGLAQPENYNMSHTLMITTDIGRIDFRVKDLGISSDFRLSGAMSEVAEYNWIMDERSPLYNKDLHYNAIDIDVLERVFFKVIYDRYFIEYFLGLLQTAFQKLTVGDTKMAA
jgi:hypothetical protein